MLREELERIATEYPDAKAHRPLKGDWLADVIRQSAAGQVREILDQEDPTRTLKVEGSPGKGNWAHVPWVGVFDPVVTTSATRGYYVVYLFSADCRRIYLSLNQGTTAVREEFGPRYTEELRRRAQLMRQRVGDYAEQFSDAAIDLASTAILPAGYEAGHAFGIRYDAGGLPQDERLAEDLRTIVRSYLQLTARGGLEPSAEADEFGEEFQGSTITEARRYRLHRRIERDSSAARKAKQVHGYTCQACGFDFESVYGKIGRSFIEAHHLTPLAELPEDKPAPQDPDKDFAVLCANCHRMIHKTDSPGDIDALRERGRLGRLRRLLYQLADPN